MQTNATIQNYRLIQKLGEGGMGEVWLAQDLRTDLKVALKVLHAHYARNAAILARFRNEALTLSKLSHPNIVRFDAFVEVDDKAFLVMEYVEGRNLEDLIRQETGPIPPEKLGPIFKQALLAIDHAHKQGVIHRDIKPSNFMLTPDGRLKVMDFGIAKLLDDNQQLTRTGMRMGTTYYMSPEQVSGGKVDHRSDIYALGVTLFVLSTGKNPYEGETVEFKVYNSIVHEPLPKARSLYPAVPARVERMIEKATAKDPALRFQSCGDFLVGAGTEDLPSPAHDQRPTAAPLDLKGFKSLRNWLYVGLPMGILTVWVPASGDIGSLSGIGTLSALAITAGCAGMLSKKYWSLIALRLSLAIYTLACIGTILFPNYSSKSSWTSTSTSWDGVTHTSYHSTNELSLVMVVAILTLPFAIWGFRELFSKKNIPFFESL